MNIEEQRYRILTPEYFLIHGNLTIIEEAARTCYKSEGKTVADAEHSSAQRLIRSCIKRGHESVLEHSILSVRFVTNRAIAQQLTRHRLCAFSMESQRYCNYTQDRFSNEISFIKPLWYGTSNAQRMLNEWEEACGNAEYDYNSAIKDGMRPEEAREFLPNCTKTELVMSTNLREWRHILKLRTAKEADPMIRNLCTPLLKELAEKLPCIFEDIAEQLEN